MRELGPAEVTRRVYVTFADYPRRHGWGGNGQLPRPAYIWLLSRRMDFTYCLVSGNIPSFCTESRPW
jgi:hypothetical protein